MSLSENSRALIDALENLPILDDRYRDMVCVNRASGADPRGMFSLVFMAFDIVNANQVALKFFDIDPDKVFNSYRVQSFRREHEILQTLIGVRRCLQVMSGFKTYMLKAGGFDIPCQYFAVQWLDEEIDHYFELQDSIVAEVKLQLFHDILLGVEALHGKEVSHRDLKKDNLRSIVEESARLVIAIDLGTAARSDTPALAPSYNASPVGALWYSAPEAKFGLAGVREIGKYTDIFALGCMLYELFNREYFFAEFLRINPSFSMVNTVFGLAVSQKTNDKDRLDALHAALDRHGKGMAAVTMIETDSSVPMGISSILDELVQSMTKFDYRSRPKSLGSVRLKVQSAIAVLRNNRLNRQRTEETKARRIEKLKRIALKEQRLADALQRRLANAK